MARVMALSSWVAHGHVGLSAAGPALARLGHEVTQLPTVMLSNHPGFPHVAGRPVPVAELAAMVDALEANGWLAGHDTLLTGYLPRAEHVGFAVKLAERMRGANPSLRLVVDPVLGDHPKGLYLDAGAAEAVRAGLAPLADVLTPNLFELEWLTRMPVGTLDEAEAAARALAVTVHVTSPPFGDGETGVLSVSPAGVLALRTPRIEGVPQGTGDVFSGLIAAGLPVGHAMAHLEALVRASAGHPHLRIAAAGWTGAEPAGS